MKKLVVLAQAIAVMSLLLIGASTPRAFAAGPAGECGEFKYWHAGHCVDARDRPSTKAWSAGMSGWPAM